MDATTIWSQRHWATLFTIYIQIYLVNKAVRTKCAFCVKWKSLFLFKLSSSFLRYINLYSLLMWSYMLMLNSDNILTIRDIVFEYMYSMFICTRIPHLLYIRNVSSILFLIHTRTQTEFECNFRYIAKRRPVQTYRLLTRTKKKKTDWRAKEHFLRDDIELFVSAYIGKKTRTHGVI